MNPREFESARVEPLPAAHLAPPGPDLATFPLDGIPAVPAPGPNYQDLTDESPSEASDEDWDAIVAAAERAFTDQDIDDMHHYLKERGLFAFLHEHLERKGIPPATLLLAFGVMVRHDASLPDQLRMLKVACSRVLRNREKLDQYNTPEDVVDLVRRSKHILFLTGAGVSTSCGIPDFRSPTGLYARLQLENNYELDDPQDMFDLAFFKEKPYVFYSFAKEIYPSAFVPSPSHRFVRLLEMENKLLRNYTQNIDGLFEQVGVERMLNCHGSFATASCLLCRRRFPGAAIEADVFASRVPLCPFCTPEIEARERERELERSERPPKKKRKTNGARRDPWDEEGASDSSDEGNGGGEGRGEWEGKAVVKPDIVFFGEALSDEFDHRLLEDREQVDLVIVMGTSLRVSPVAQLPSHLPHSVPQILINRDPVTHHQFDVVLLGDGDGVVQWLCEALARAEMTDDDIINGGPGAGVQVGSDGQDEEKRIVEQARRRKRWDLDARVPVQRPAHGRGDVVPATATGPAQAKSLPEPSVEASTLTHSGNGEASNRDDPADGLPSLPASAHPPATRAATVEPERVGTSHVWLFPGANRQSRWVHAVREAYSEGGEAGDGAEVEADREDHAIEGSRRDDEEEEEEEEAEAEAEGAGPAAASAAVELPASLAPGAPEGNPSDVDSDQEDADGASSSSSAGA